MPVCHSKGAQAGPRLLPLGGASHSGGLVLTVHLRAHTIVNATESLSTRPGLQLAFWDPSQLGRKEMRMLVPTEVWSQPPPGQEKWCS